MTTLSAALPIVALFDERSAVSYQRSAVSGQRSAISGQLSAISFKSWAGC
ncbi:MAG: hypothetical protein KME42_03035 [Tildeniella nuda ZEHNDER 1965/U140]|nr:hypothetical protein [Tildeniella nuda ZEHNDER 1965/U140]